MSDDNSAGGERELLIMAGAGWVQAVDANNGEVAWLLDLETPKPATPSVGLVGDHVVVATSGQLYCVDRASGEKVWQRPCLGAPSRPTLLVEGERIYLSGRSRTECFDASGKQLWSAQAPLFTTGYVALATHKSVAQADVS